MPSAPPAAAPPRAARAAVGTWFFVNAVLYTNVLPRLPEIKDALDLSNASLGTALAAGPVGALAATLWSAPLIRRLGSGPLAAYGLVVLAVAMTGVAFAPSWGVLAAVLFLAGAVDALVDVAQNAHGLRVQRRYDRSIFNAFHGIWSIGAVSGALIGSAAAGLAVPLPWHLGVVGGVFAVLAVIAGRARLPGADEDDRTPEAPGSAAGNPGRSRVRLRSMLVLAALGLLAAAGVFVEDAGASWSAIYLRGDLGAGPAVAGLGLVALQTAMTVGRLTGDRVVDRFGQRTVARTGGALIALGMGAALAFPSVPATLAGLAVAGLGAATLVPAAYAAADALPGLPPGAGLSMINWLLRVGLLASPPLVGVIADQAGLRTGLLTVVAAGVVAVLVSGVLRGRSARSDADPAG
ncbi:MFS transporter [Blastococcus saxobsidens]|uniref:Fucose permease n=1 Tax=Blastococcus saxobsidens TaxID=138336 RepID=A0A4V2G262_9ACTN|nr:MFS transporter [Blastococcus saxobsidens]RZU31856.1 fucose permease [Blastococcus saxobsidens]